ncbi:hypothetical protein SAMN02910317_00912 [Ruminococcaceae bacterium FB2012]|nr:hypothetical protein SAMN02910317_00912 [Ruminococcaceae bacterium FB2012]
MNTAAETALHGLIEDRQPNICQVTAYRDNKKVYSDTRSRVCPSKAATGNSSRAGCSGLRRG